MPVSYLADRKIELLFEGIVMENCIFCKIVSGEIPVRRVYEDRDVLVFPDRNPRAKVHLLIIPKRHFDTTLDMSDQAPEIFGAMLRASSEAARIFHIDKSGFRLVIRTNADGGQEIFHVHMHLLGGEPIGALRCKS
jgi:diadenosine tetraphosphate (Ap4A) HIT family hydrolase